MNDFLLIIDGCSLLTTIYYGILPPVLRQKFTSEAEEAKHYDKIMQTKDGLYTNAIYGFMKTLLSLLANQNPKYIVVNWDANRSTTFRRQLYSEYKATRKNTPLPLKQQEETIRKMLKFIGIKQFMSDTFEADDFAGSLAKKFENETYVRILTKDRDHLQLVNDKTNIWLTFPVDKDGNSQQVLDLNTKFNVPYQKMIIPSNVFGVNKNLVKDFYGVEANQVVDLKALMGDTADNIPGVKGIGEKTAITLLETFNDLNNLYSYIENNTDDVILVKFKEIKIRSGNKVLELLRDKKSDAYLSQQLATINCNINFGDIKLSDFERNINMDNLKASLERLEFQSLINKYF